MAWRGVVETGVINLRLKPTRPLAHTLGRDGRNKSLFIMTVY